MAMANPKGRANYEPNSWGAEGGPRENPDTGFRSFPEEIQDTKVRLRPELFADHYSQARQFYISQTPIEQKHIADALVFELGKCGRADIRSRVVSHLLNIDDGLAQKVANGLGLPLPEAARAARERVEFEPSEALSIVKRGPPDFGGRKLGVYLTDGADAALFAALVRAVEGVGAVYEVVAPKVGGVTLSDGTAVAAKNKIDGGPSVLFDAVALVVSAEGAARIGDDAVSQDFVRDAFGHCKFIGYSGDALPLFEKAGIAAKLDEACIALASAKDAARFIASCGALRHWDRELKVDMDAWS